MVQSVYTSVIVKGLVKKYRGGRGGPEQRGGGGGVGRSSEGVGHEVLSLVPRVVRAIFSYP